LTAAAVAADSPVVEEFDQEFADAVAGAWSLLVPFPLGSHPDGTNGTGFAQLTTRRVFV